MTGGEDTGGVSPAALEPQRSYRDRQRDESASLPDVVHHFTFRAMQSPNQAIEEARAAAAGSAGKREYVQRIFSEIAPRYDLLNHLLSAGIDRRWRTRAIDGLGWSHRPDDVYLDLCAGTLDVAVQLARQSGFRGMVLGADFAEPMLRAGASKAPRERVAPITSDALALPLRDASVAGAVVAFGIRNLADLDEGLREVLRVLRPGGRFVILEFSTPRVPLLRAAYRFYFHRVLPLIGGLISGHPTAYRYLPESVDRFPEQAALAHRMTVAGFTDVVWRNLSFGIAALHIGRRPG
jgi:demethylmenaquinone methyltransferase / 2-methoxy-6-polyprenyl-1,4-benzoquinol methylase